MRSFLFYTEKNCLYLKWEIRKFEYRLAGTHILFPKTEANHGQGYFIKLKF